MTLCDTMDLIKVEKSAGADGYPVDTETVTTVRCDSGSGVSRAEFYEAYKAGIKASATFSMWECDYDGQQYAVHNGKRHKILRSFPLGDGSLQLNCSEVI